MHAACNSLRPMIPTRLVIYLDCADSMAHRQQSGSLPKSEPENNFTFRMTDSASYLISHYCKIHERVKSGESIVKILNLASVRFL